MLWCGTCVSRTVALSMECRKAVSLGRRVCTLACERPTMFSMGRTDSLLVVTTLSSVLVLKVKVRNTATRAGPMLTTTCMTSRFKAATAGLSASGKFTKASSMCGPLQTKPPAQLLFGQAATRMSMTGLCSKMICRGRAERAYILPS